MDLTRKRVAAAGVIGVGAMLGAMAGVIHAGAVSAGGYSYEQQGCSATADRNTPGSYTEPGCHSFTAQVNQGDHGYGSKWHPASFNLDQTPNGTSAHSGTVVVDPGQGTSYTVPFDTGQGQLLNLGLTSYPLDVFSWALGLPGDAGNFPMPNIGNLQPGMPSVGMPQAKNSHGGFKADSATNWQFYMGADDNLDNGEHDGVNPADPASTDPNGHLVSNGPSDGGAVQANTHPTSDPTQNVDPTDMHNPVRAADAGFGECADGQCVALDTERRKIYQGGCSSCADQSVYSDQSTTDWRSPDCNSGSVQNENECGSGWNSSNYPACNNGIPANDDDSKSTDQTTSDGDCDDGPISQPYDERGAYYTDPGVMVYEDPDPQSSPALPMYPICEEYVGTQGVYTCGMPGVNPPAGVVPAAPSTPKLVPAHGSVITTPLGAGPGGR